MSMQQRKIRLWATEFTDHTNLTFSNGNINEVRAANFLIFIVLLVLLWFIASDYPFGIFKLFFREDFPTSLQMDGWQIPTARWAKNFPTDLEAFKILHFLTIEQI